MKNIYLLLFLLIFSSQNTFSQDYTKITASEKSKMVMYGGYYPYSLLLESGSDTLYLQQKGLYLIFEEGKLLQVDKEGGSTNKYIYQNEKIVRVESYDEKDTTYLIATYNEDSVKYVVPSPVVMPFNNKNFVGCNDVSEGYSCCCVYYQGDTIFQDGSKWIFLKDKVITEYHPMGEFPNFNNYKKAFFVRDGYVNIIVENVITKEQLKNPFLQGDFESEEKRETKIKVLKSPADKPKKEEIIEVENDIELDDN